ncbi:hypothetical protein NLJ89_g8082 [Agrocybe chaxingu]|uniref:DUF6533 domain-containing protein n=1 Tax=Agrocybe chaxingu TaxID=84603 RepID=A0A9W8K2E8_9AGAR|nr:hypothetical protein NLJ89_g8082 [Agrocybe chaxingu]
MSATDAPTAPVFQLPNPLTPMAFLPPDLAFQVTIATYVLVGATAVMVWDFISHLADDYRLVTRYRIGLATIVYFVSRIGALTYLVGTAVMNTAPIGYTSCTAGTKVISAFVAVAIPGTSFLLFLHVRAIYSNNKYIVGFFGFLWIAVLGGALTAPIGGSTNKMVTLGQYCAQNVLPEYTSAAVIIPTVNDTLLYLSIVWHMLRCSYAESTVSNKFRTLAFGDHLPALSRALLKNGQAYFLSTVGLNLVALTMFYIDSIPIPYRAMFGVPNIALMNMMASRLFRCTKFGKYRTNLSASTTRLNSSSNGRANCKCSQPILVGPAGAPLQVQIDTFRTESDYPPRREGATEKRSEEQSKDDYPKSMV